MSCFLCEAVILTQCLNSSTFGLFHAPAFVGLSEELEAENPSLNSIDKGDMNGGLVSQMKSMKK